LKAGEWFRRGRLVIVSPGLQLSWLLSGRNSTYPAVQTFKASSASTTSPSRPLLIPMAVTGYAGFRQGTTAITNFLPGTRRLRKKGPFRGWGYLTRSAGNEVDLDKSAPVARGRHKESRPRAS
jgi:hypothetical protein